jgi:hypothetical protein
MGTEATPRFDERLERITTREQALRHLTKILEPGQSFNPSSFEAEIYEDPEKGSDIVIFFRTDNEEFATTSDPYTVFLNRYNLAVGTIPAEKFTIDDWNGAPYLRVTVFE